MFGNWLFMMISIFNFNLLTYNWWIHLQLTRIAVAFARWNFLSFLSLKTKKFQREMRELYAYVAIESTQTQTVF